MKYVVVIGDGMADWKIPELGYRTPLMAADIPNADFMASKGLSGKVQVVSKQIYPGSDVSNLSILGYDPEEYYTGRSPLEAASIGVDLSPDEVAVRCNMVTLEGGLNGGEMVDYSAGHISTKEATLIIEDLNSETDGMGVLFYPGMSYRNLMVWEGGIDSVETVPPHEIMGKEVGAYLPAGEGSRILKKIMAISEDVMKQHPVNSERIRSGKLAATSVWLWGQGKAPILPSFESAFGLKGSVIAAVDLVRGIGRYLGLRLIDVTGATGYVDTNFEGKGKACIDQLEENDMVLVHVEAPDEAGHNGDFLTKIDSIEKIDLHILGPLLEKIKGGDDIRVLFLPDHPTPVEIRTHSNEPVPFLIYPTPDVNDSSYINPSGYSEDEADKTGYVVAKGTELMGLLTKE